MLQEFHIELVELLILLIVLEVIKQSQNLINALVVSFYEYFKKLLGKSKARRVNLDYQLRDEPDRVIPERRVRLQLLQQERQKRAKMLLLLLLLLDLIVVGINLFLLVADIILLLLLNLVLLFGLLFDLFHLVLRVNHALGLQVRLSVWAELLNLLQYLRIDFSVGLDGQYKPGYQKQQVVVL